MRGQKRVEDARERAYAPRIHLLREKFLRRLMDCRVKPGNDELEFVAMRFRGGERDARNDHGASSSAARSSAASMRSTAPDGWSRPMRARQSRSSRDGADAKNPRANRPASRSGEAARNS